MTQRVVNYTYGTGNPVLPNGSIDVRDGIDNLQSFDIFMNADEDTYNQRDGEIVRTVAGMNNEFDTMTVGMNSEFDAQILNMGFTRVGTFSSGATLTNPRQTLLWDIADGGDGQEYGWSGSFPKVVPTASTPTSTGGISVGAWVSRFDPELRTQVREAQRRSYAEAGYNLVSGSFEAGGTLVNANDVLLYEADGHAYNWDGAYPGGGKIVPPGSTPTPQGPGGWVSAGDETLRSDLAKPWGASLVGFQQAGAGAVSRTAQDKMCERVTPKDFGAIGDGTLHLLSERFTTLALAQATYPHVTSLTQTIDWAAFQAAFNTNAVTIDYRSGNYVLNADLYRNKSTQLIGDAVSKIKMVNGSKLLIEGALVALPKLSANVTMTSRSLTFVGTPALSAGDSIVLYNPTDFSWSLHRSYYREGEFFKIFGVTGNVADIYGLPSDAYTASAMDVYRIDGVTVTLDNVVVEGESTLVGAPIVVRFGVNVVVNSFKGRQSSSYQLELDRCFGVDVFGGSAVNNSPYVDDEYGIIISNCTDVVVHGGSHFAQRHAIAIGGGGGVCAVPNRNIKIIGAALRNRGADIGAADMHGNCDNVEYINCEIRAHANMAGRNVRYKGCRIYQRTTPADGACIYGSEIVGGLYEIIDCELITHGDLAAFGAVHFSCREVLREALVVKVSNLTVRGGGGGALAKLVAVFAAAGETKTINVDIRGVRCDLTTALAVLYAASAVSTSTVFASGGFIVDDVYGPAGMSLVYPSGTGIQGVPTREMAQRGNATVTTAASTTVVFGSSVQYRYKYSRLPRISMGVSSPNGAPFTLPGKTPIPYAYSYDANGLRPAIAADTAFTAGTDVRIHWAVGVTDI